MDINLPPIAHTIAINLIDNGGIVYETLELGELSVVHSISEMSFEETISYDGAVSHSIGSIEIAVIDPVLTQDTDAEFKKNWYQLSSINGSGSSAYVELPWTQYNLIKSETAWEQATISNSLTWASESNYIKSATNNTGSDKGTNWYIAKSFGYTTDSRKIITGIGLSFKGLRQQASTVNLQIKFKVNGVDSEVKTATIDTTANTWKTITLGGASDKWNLDIDWNMLVDPNIKVYIHALNVSNTYYVALDDVKLTAYYKYSSGRMASPLQTITAPDKWDSLTHELVEPLPSNLLLNNQADACEDGTTWGWCTNSNGVIDVSDEDDGDSTKSLIVTCPATNDGAATDPHNSVKPSTQYSVKFKMKGTGTVKIQICSRNVNYGIISCATSSNITLTSTFTEYTYTTTSTSDAVYMNAKILSASGVATIYVVKASLNEGTPIAWMSGTDNKLTENQANSGGDGTTTGFQAVNGAQIFSTTEQAHSGSRSLKVVATGTQEKQGVITTPIKIKKGEVLEFRVWIKGSGTTDLKIREVESDGTWIGTRIEKKITATSEWTEHSIASVCYSDYINIGFYNDIPAQTTIYADDWKLIRLSNMSVDYDIFQEISLVSFQPSTPNLIKTFGSTGRQKIAQQFLTPSANITGIELVSGGVTGSPSDSVFVNIYTNSSGAPGSASYTQYEIPAASWPASGQILRIPFDYQGGSTPTTLWVVIGRTGQLDNVNYYNIKGYLGSQGSYNDGIFSYYNGSSWMTENLDLPFTVYGGQNLMTGEQAPVNLPSDLPLSIKFRCNLYSSVVGTTPKIDKVVLNMKDL